MSLISNKKINKKFWVFLTACIGGFLLYLWFVFNGVGSLFGNLAEKAINKGKFNQVVPGESTVGNLEKTYGKPAGTEAQDDSSLLFYESQHKYQYEYAWTEDGKVIATKERLPEINKDDFIKELGPYDLLLYDELVYNATWLVFLDKGLGVQIAGDKAYALIRFAPQLENSFLSNIAPIVGMVSEQPKEGHPGEPGI